MNSTTIEKQGAFLGIDTEYDSAQVVILPVPFEQTVSYGKGTAHGPGSLIDASSQVEFFDDELGIEIPDKISFHTLDAVDSAETSERMCERLTDISIDLIRDQKWIMAFGGEHSITPGFVKAQAEFHDDFGILQIDAHSDLRDSYNGDKYSHASAMARSINLAPIIGVGIRSHCNEELFLINSDRYSLFAARDFNRTTSPKQISDQLPKKVYVTFDLDGLDPSVIPGTGTPEPGGLGWYDVLALLKTVAEEHEIIGCDIVELAPIAGSHVSEFAAAKLATKLMTYSQLL
ncbi:MAG: agmatinase [Candidatus Lindowbacteria bacterium]|nr:agmatinase [Candidatus Lindowbacteria bacterium]